MIDAILIWVSVFAAVAAVVATVAFAIWTVYKWCDREFFDDGEDE